MLSGSGLFSRRPLVTPAISPSTQQPCSSSSTPPPPLSTPSLSTTTTTETTTTTTSLPTTTTTTTNDDGLELHRRQGSAPLAAAYGLMRRGSVRTITSNTTVSR